MHIQETMPFVARRLVAVVMFILGVQQGKICFLPLGLNRSTMVCITFKASTDTLSCLKSFQAVNAWDKVAAMRAAHETRPSR